MKKVRGILLCAGIGVPSWYLGKLMPIIGGPVFAIVLGIIVALFLKDRVNLDEGIKFTSKKILQYAVILLGFGLNVQAILASGKESLPIIFSTIAVSLIVAYLIQRIFKIDKNVATLIGVGSSICGGSAIAAASTAIRAKDEEIAQSISVIFLFNVIAALIFPSLGEIFSMTDYSFGIFAGTAVNDTSSVTAAASAWDSIHNGNSLEVATIVKLTRTLAIIPITAFLSYSYSKKNKSEDDSSFNLLSIFPTFILFFLGAAITRSLFDIPVDILIILKQTSKFFIIMAMAAIGLNTNIVKLIKGGAKPIGLGLACWISIIMMSLLVQNLTGLAH